VRARISVNGVDLEASAASVRIGGGGVELGELKLEGAGDLELSFRTRPSGLELHARGRDVDLTRLARLIELDGKKLMGRASFEVDLKRKGSRLDGKLQARFDEASVSDFGPLSGTVNALARNGRIDGDASLALHDAFEAQVRLVGLSLPGELGFSALRQGRGGLEAEGRVRLLDDDT
jgi:hypothetical protein